MFTKKLLPAAVLVLLAAFLSGEAFAATTSIDPYDISSDRNRINYSGNKLQVVVKPLRVQYTALLNGVAAAKLRTSVYVYKTSFKADGSIDLSNSAKQDGKRGFMQGIRECYITVMPDINDASQVTKVYEFPVQNLTNTTNVDLYWDGYTDPKLTNPGDANAKPQLVRDCVYVVVQDANNNNNVLYTAFAGGSGSMERFMTMPAIIYDAYADPNDPNHTKTISTNQRTVSAEVDVPDNGLQYKELYAVLMTDNCGIGGLTYNTVNQGALPMLRDINGRPGTRGEVAAYINLTDMPYTTATVQGSLGPATIRKYKWTDIQRVDPATAQPLTRTVAGTQMPIHLLRTDVYPYYRLALIYTTDNKTFTGINDGYFDTFDYQELPYTPGADPADVSANLTAINTTAPPVSGIKINPVLGGFRIDDEEGVCRDMSISAFNMAGQKVWGKTLPSQSTQEVSAELSPNQIYTIVVTGTGANGPKQAVLKFMKTGRN